MKYHHKTNINKTIKKKNYEAQFHDYIVSLKQSGYANLIMNKHIHRQEWGGTLKTSPKINS